MICYYERGDRQFKFREREGFPVLGVADLAEAEGHWQAACEANPTGLFNGQVFSCNRVEDDGTNLTLDVSKVDYSTYKWARDNRRLVPGAYAMGNGMLLRDTQREAYVLLERSKTTAFDEGKISGIGGVLDYQQGVTGDMLGYVKAQTLKEVDEEVVTGDDCVHAVGLLGLYVDDQTLKVEFVYTGEGKVTGVKAGENKSLVVVPAKNLPEFTALNADRLEQSTKIHLEHWAEKLAGKS